MMANMNSIEETYLAKKNEGMNDCPKGDGRKWANKHLSVGSLQAPETSDLSDW